MDTPAPQDPDVLRRAHHGAFGGDTFGVWAERFARFFGTPKYLLGQTFLVLCWIAFNAVTGMFDPYPFILLNLVFSTQASYAAPLILLAQTRAAERDKQRGDLERAHREELAATHQKLLDEILTRLDRGSCRCAAGTPTPEEGDMGSGSRAT